jgi:hypothetical protein
MTKGRRQKAEGRMGGLPRKQCSPQRCRNQSAYGYTNKQQRFSQRQQQREQWQALFADDAIELRHLPKVIVKKARTVLSALQQGTHYWQLSGKRLEMMHDVIRIPVTRRYRLLCREDGDQIVPVKVLSHEDYNPLIRSPKRFLSRLLSRKP